MVWIMSDRDGDITFGPANPEEVAAVALIIKEESDDIRTIPHGSQEHIYVRDFAREAYDRAREEGASRIIEARPAWVKPGLAAAVRAAAARASAPRTLSSSTPSSSSSVGARFKTAPEDDVAGPDPNAAIHKSKNCDETKVGTTRFDGSRRTVRLEIA